MRYYSLYLLYWYKSTNSDAAGASAAMRTFDFTCFTGTRVQILTQEAPRRYEDLKTKSDDNICKLKEVRRRHVGGRSSSRCSSRPHTYLLTYLCKLKEVRRTYVGGRSSSRCKEVCMRPLAPPYIPPTCRTYVEVGVAQDVAQGRIHTSLHTSYIPPRPRATTIFASSRRYVCGLELRLELLLAALSFGLELRVCGLELLLERLQGAIP
jgi:hypothetical protein